MKGGRYKSWTEIGAIVAAIAYPVSAIPQAVKIFATKDAGDLSLLTWLSFALIEILFFAYGITHRLRPIIISGVLWAIVYAFIITGIFIYG